MSRVLADLRKEVGLLKLSNNLSLEITGKIFKRNLLWRSPRRGVYAHSNSRIVAGIKTWCGINTVKMLTGLKRTVVSEEARVLCRRTTGANEGRENDFAIS